MDRAPRPSRRTTRSIVCEPYDVEKHVRTGRNMDPVRTCFSNGDGG